MRLGCRAVLLAFVLTLVASAQNKTIHVPADQPTIQAGIDAASNGDIVIVAPGTYHENIDFKGKSIEVTSNNGGTTYPVTTTIIDGSGLGPVVNMSNSTDTADAPTLQGFTIQNGGIPQTAGGPHGAIYAVTPGTTLSVPVIESNIIKNNFCQGIYISGPGTDILYNEIELTTVPATCPALEGNGSAVYIGASNYVTIVSGNTIELNTASVAASSDKGGGAGINISGLLVSYVTDNIIRNNTTTGYGGGIYYANASGVYLEHNLIYGNKGISGGVDLVVPGATTGSIAGLIANNTIAENTGIGTSSNVASDLFIGGNLAQYVVINNIIVGYTNGQSAINCSTAYAAQTLTPLVFDHNDIYSMPSGTNRPFGGACTTPAGTFGNISVDPAFKSATAAALAAGTSDFHLQTGSPAIDTGNNYILVFGSPVALDPDGTSIPQDATAVGYAIVDMGAYEAPSSGPKDPTGTALYVIPDKYQTYTYSAGQSAILTMYLYENLPSLITMSNGGNLTVNEDSGAIGTLTASGAQTIFTTPPLTQGIHSFYVTYGGDSPASPATSVEFYLTVGPAAGAITTTTLTSSLNPSNVGDNVTFTATVSASTTPTGTVTFAYLGGQIGATQTLDANGKASVSTATLPSGHVGITANYTPAGNFEESGTQLTQVVNGLPTTSTIISAPATSTQGSSVSLQASVAPTTPPGVGTPTGYVSFSTGGTALGQAQLNGAGVATLSTTALPPGSDPITCTYLGDDNYSTSDCTNSPVTDVRASSTLMLTAISNPSYALAPVTFKAVLTYGSGTPAPAGNTITLTIGTTSIVLTTDATGTATYTAPGFDTSAGIPVTAAFAQTATLFASSAMLQQVVNPNPTKTALSGSPNPGAYGASVTLTAIVSTSTESTAPPSGTVQFFDGTTALGTATLTASTATTATSTLTAPSLALGGHTLTASYNPANIDFLNSSNNIAYTVAVPDFSITAAQSPFLVPVNGSATNLITLTSTTGFQGTIQIACPASIPSGNTCALSAPAVTLTVGGTATTTLTVTNKSSSQTTGGGFFGSLSTPTRITLAALFPAALLLLPRRRRRLACALLLAAFLLTGALSITGCKMGETFIDLGHFDLVLTASGISAGLITPTTHALDIPVKITK